MGDKGVKKKTTLSIDTIYDFRNCEPLKKTKPESYVAWVCFAPLKDQS